ncbi:hypothetical protein L486_00482 [Kwoniella mangroviensis CBS 10435]|uniref:Uncharacterized protein n=1 Tax=Kwoniella mangroviensis CBS 10435 TaxID=1331196 RepID=A0A1B9IZ76_9TREE|nr:uncharacterized protein I203_06197 [Kwoniella mangroviensis CBS 8507]OCF60841.1 hypothetical protein L486_00482 [Kwoniella mangroviensis CBS 10435]OCF64467.1 hypothetical protein I203_06197 [Kwoniella mangroviensis CBS 8507]OCF74408.1 hypothetical protein I204_04782 [Kwoniella mangroviensis CBS 8886]
MGLLDFLPCCGPRKDKVRDVESQTQENSTLLPPPAREESIISADGLVGSYGATEQGLTDEQRMRIEAIGREVGNLQIQRSSPSLPKPNGGAPSSRDSSRPSSPSPMRPDTTPPDGVLRSPDRPGGEGADDGVVRKTLFAGGGNMTGRKVSSRGKGKSRGGKSRK